MKPHSCKDCERTEAQGAEFKTNKGHFIQEKNMMIYPKNDYCEDCINKRLSAMIL